MTRACTLALTLTILVVPSALADHSVGLRSEGLSPLVTALLWGGLAFLVGMVVVIIVTVLTRKAS